MPSLPPGRARQVVWARARSLLAVGLLAVTVGACNAGDDDATAPTSTSTPTSTTRQTSSTSVPPTGPDCSASGLASEPPPQPSLPPPVDETRRAIVSAAVACDFEKLAQLASTGDARFTFSYGGGGAVADHWAAAEEAGEEPLRRLVAILGTPPRVVTAAEPDHVVWPSAFAYERWSDVPEPDRQALQDIYSQEELEQFARFGSYVGYRVGVTSDGEWIFFVAGD